MPWPNPMLLRKDCARTGEFWVPGAAGAHTPSRLTITDDRLTRWIHTFHLMQQQGVRVDLTLDHQPHTRARVGRITHLYRCSASDLTADPQGTHLAFICEPGHPELLPLILQNPEASIELSTNFQDGLGRHYPEAITAISLVRHPVIPGQRPFELLNPITQTWSAPFQAPAALDQQADQPRHRQPQKLSRTRLTPSRSNKTQTQAPRTQPNRRTTMNQEHLLTQLADAVGMTPTETESLDADLLIDQVRQLRVTQQDAKSLRQQVDELLEERDTLAARLDESADAASQPFPAIEEDALEDLVDGYRSRLDRLVDEGRISPACSLKLGNILFGQPGERPAICLSRRAATHAGLPSPPARAILDALSLNPPFTGSERSGPQLLALSHPNPGTPRNQDLNHALKQWIEQANHPRPDQAVI